MTGLADAIRERGATSDPIALKDMAAAITNLSTGQYMKFAVLTPKTSSAAQMFTDTVTFDSPIRPSESEVVVVANASYYNTDAVTVVPSAAHIKNGTASIFKCFRVTGSTDTQYFYFHRFELTGTSLSITYYVMGTDAYKWHVCRNIGVAVIGN